VDNDRQCNNCNRGFPVSSVRETVLSCCCVLCIVLCLNVFLLCICVTCLLCPIVVLLPPGENPIAVK
jgi:hypothetical protein